MHAKGAKLHILYTHTHKTDFSLANTHNTKHFRPSNSSQVVIPRPSHLTLISALREPTLVFHEEIIPYLFIVY